MLIVNQKAEDVVKGLEAWDWIDFSGKEAFVTTCFGDVFFVADDGIYFLDSIGGTLDRVASTKQELQDILNTQEGQEHYLMTGLAIAAQESGLQIKEGECFDFKVSPILGGLLEVDNIHVLPFVVALDVAGQIMKQVKDLPPGAVIDKVTLGDA